MISKRYIPGINHWSSTDDEGATPLHYALIGGGRDNVQILQFLLKKVHANICTCTCIDLVNCMYMYVRVHCTCIHGNLFSCVIIFRSCMVLEAIFID